MLFEDSPHDRADIQALRGPDDLLVALVDRVAQQIGDGNAAGPESADLASAFLVQSDVHERVVTAQRCHVFTGPATGPPGAPG